MLTLAFVLLLNNADGSQVELSRSLMSADACFKATHAIWALDDVANPIVYVDENGNVNRIDAACINPATK